jgi:hypothetical protein
MLEKGYDDPVRRLRRNVMEGMFIETTALVDVDDAAPAKSRITPINGGTGVALASLPGGGGGGGMLLGGQHQEEQPDHPLSPSDKTPHLVESFRRRGESNFGETSDGKSSPPAIRSSSDLFLESIQSERQRTDERIQVIKKLRLVKERQSKDHSVAAAAVSREPMAQPAVARMIVKECSDKGDGSSTGAPVTMTTRSNPRGAEKEILLASNQPGHGVKAKAMESGAIRYFQYFNPTEFEPSVRAGNMHVNFKSNFKSVERRNGVAKCPYNENTIVQPLTYGQMLRATAASRDDAGAIVTRPMARQHRPPDSPNRTDDHQNKDKRMTSPPATTLHSFGAGSFVGRKDDAVRPRGDLPPASVVVRRHAAPWLEDWNNSSASRYSTKARMDSRKVQVDRRDDADETRDEATPSTEQQRVLDTPTLDARESSSTMRYETIEGNQDAQADRRDSPSPLSDSDDQTAETSVERGRADSFLVELAKAKSDIFELQQRLAAADNATQAYKEALQKLRPGKMPFWKRNVQKKDKNLSDDIGNQIAKDNEDLVKQLMLVIQTLPVCDEISLRINLANGEGGWDIVSARAENFTTNDVAEHFDSKAQE